MRVQACRRAPVGPLARGPLARWPVGPLFIRRPMAPAVASEDATWRDLRCLARGGTGGDLFPRRQWRR